MKRGTRGRKSRSGATGPWTHSWTHPIADRHNQTRSDAELASLSAEATSYRSVITNDVTMSCALGEKCAAATRRRLVRTRKPVGSYGSRGFESLPLRCPMRASSMLRMPRWSLTSAPPPRGRAVDPCWGDKESRIVREGSRPPNRSREPSVSARDYRWPLPRTDHPSLSVVL